MCSDMDGRVGSNWETRAVACSLSLNSLSRVAAVVGGGGAPTLEGEGYQHLYASLIRSLPLTDPLCEASFNSYLKVTIIYRHIFFCDFGIIIILQVLNFAIFTCE